MSVLDVLEGKEFDNKVFSSQRLKMDFVCFLWLESKLFIDDCPLTLVSFLNSWALVEALFFFGIFLLFEPW